MAARWRTTRDNFLDDRRRPVAEQKGSAGPPCRTKEKKKKRDAGGLGTGGLGPWPRASWTKWRRCNSRQWATALLRIRHVPPGIPRRWQLRRATTAAAPRPLEVHGVQEEGLKSTHASFAGSGGLRAIVGRRRCYGDSIRSLPVVGYAARRSKTLRPLGGKRCGYFDSSGSTAIRWARWPRRSRHCQLTRVLYPDDPPEWAGLRFVQEDVMCLLAWRPGTAIADSGADGSRSGQRSPSR